jgi:Flp pilus assembly protein CpaB
MGDQTSPPATRLRQPSWTDARLVAGVLMVLLAVLGGAAVVSAADKSVEVWAVRRSLTAGTTLAKDDLAARRVRLYGADKARYLDVHLGNPAGRVLTRDLGEGELLPKAALGGDTASAKRLVGLPLTRAHALGGTVRHGDRVDVLATRKTTGGGYTTYAVVHNVLVNDVNKPSGGFGAGGGNDFVVLIEVEPGQVLAIAAAIQSAQLDLSLVVRGADGPGDVGGESVQAK